MELTIYKCDICGAIKETQSDSISGWYSLRRWRTEKDKGDNFLSDPGNIYLSSSSDICVDCGTKMSLKDIYRALVESDTQFSGTLT